MTQTEETVRHPLFARLYLRMASRRMASVERQHRARLLEGLRGRVIEVGAGNGLNFGFYPADVTEVVAVEPEPLLRKAAIEAAKDAPVSVTVVDGLASRLPADDESFDAGVASLVLCSVVDQAQALAELHRVIKPGGELRYYEHVVAQSRFFRRLQRVGDATLWPRVGGGCHLSRDTGAALEHAGFAIETQERSTFTPGIPVPPLPHILGVARRQQTGRAVTREA